MENAIQEPIVRRSARLLAAVLELHKQGYQDLAIHSGIALSGRDWCCSILPFSRIFFENASIVCHVKAGDETAHHISGDNGYDYFGWTDTATDNARELAEKIKSRFPKLLASCDRANFAMSGWLTYSLGWAERGLLPVMYSNLNQHCATEIATTGHTKIKRPPYREIERCGLLGYTYSDPPHLRPGENWHTAYIAKIENWRASAIKDLPRYPTASSHIYEVGAYWEGAVFYIQEILGFRRIDAFLNVLEDPPYGSERWVTFFKVWNDQGQLDYLKAFLIRNYSACWVHNHGA